MDIFEEAERELGLELGELEGTFPSDFVRKTTMVSKTCKRCGQVARYDDPFHRGFGARSRIDNKTMICSDCGVDEAMENFLNGTITPMSEWACNR